MRKLINLLSDTGFRIDDVFIISLLPQTLDQRPIPYNLMNPKIMDLLFWRNFTKIHIKWQYLVIESQLTIKTFIELGPKGLAFWKIKLLRPQGLIEMFYHFMLFWHFVRWLSCVLVLDKLTVNPLHEKHVSGPVKQKVIHTITSTSLNACFMKHFGALTYGVAIN